MSVSVTLDVLVAVILVVTDGVVVVVVVTCVSIHVQMLPTKLLA